VRSQDGVASGGVGEGADATHLADVGLAAAEEVGEVEGVGD